MQKYNSQLVSTEKPKSFEGYWQVFDAVEPPRFGILNLSDGSLRLEFRDDREHLRKRDFSKIMLEECLPTITGTIKRDKHVTLFGCTLTGRRHSDDSCSYEISALSGVEGITLSSWTEPFARSMYVKITNIQRWLGISILEDSRADAELHSYKFVESWEQTYNLSDGLSISLRQSLRTQYGWDEYTFSPSVDIWLHFEKAKSMQDVIREWTPWTTILLSLLIGTPVYASEVGVFAQNPFGTDESLPPSPRGKVLGIGGTLSAKEQTIPNPERMPASFSKLRTKMGSVLTKWQRTRSRLRPVIDLFAATTLYSPMYDDAQFLALVQALEIFHTCSGHFESADLPREELKIRCDRAIQALPEDLRAWATGKLQNNQKSLRQKIEEIMLTTPEDSAALFGNLKDAASRIAYTRNALTHHHANKDDKRYMSQSELATVGVKLEAFLWMLLLGEIDLKEAAKPILARALSTTVISLDG